MFKHYTYIVLIALLISCTEKVEEENTSTVKEALKAQINYQKSIFTWIATDSSGLSDGVIEIDSGIILYSYEDIISAFISGSKMVSDDDTSIMQLELEIINFGTYDSTQVMSDSEKFITEEPNYMGLTNISVDGRSYEVLIPVKVESDSSKLTLEGKSRVELEKLGSFGKLDANSLFLGFVVYADKTKPDILSQ